MGNLAGVGPPVAALSAHEGEALDLRISGKSYRAIAAAMDCSVGMAHNYVQGALAKSDAAMRAKGEAYRELEALRLDELLGALWPVATGATNVLPASEKTAPDEAAFDALVKATDRVLRIMERRAKMLGLDVPPPPRAEPDAGATLTTEDKAMDDLMREKFGGAPMRFDHTGRAKEPPHAEPDTERAGGVVRDLPAVSAPLDL